MILILEDNIERIAQFHTVCGHTFPSLELRICSSAQEMINELQANWTQLKLISLDHDLVPLTKESPDPGTGYEVVQWLADKSIICPLIIHTSNGERGTWMEGEFSRTKWQYRRIYPYGDDWISTNWAKVAQLLLGVSQNY